MLIGQKTFLAFPGVFIGQKPAGALNLDVDWIEPVLAFQGGVDWSENLSNQACLGPGKLICQKTILASPEVLIGQRIFLACPGVLIRLKTFVACPEGVVWT